jgi:hypothetical protein
MRTAPQGDLARGILSVVHRPIGDFVRYARIPVRIRATSLRPLACASLGEFSRATGPRYRGDAGGGSRLPSRRWIPITR